MTVLGKLVQRIRSKNAGPFWVTVDVFCGSADAYKAAQRALPTDIVAAGLRQPADAIKRFDMPDLYVIKFSFPRPIVQGAREDRDMHGAQWAVLLAEMDVS